MHDHDWLLIGEDTNDSIYWCTRCGALGKSMAVTFEGVEVELTEYPTYAERGNDG